MKKAFYPRLALNGIKVNIRLYLPYFFAASVLMSLFYILAFLADREYTGQTVGGGMIPVILRASWIIIVIFSALFLFYMYSFLLKRRKTEFGMYNVLGMNKSNIMKVLICEIIIVFGVTFIIGTGTGILLSKLAEILMMNVLGGKCSSDIEIDKTAFVQEFCIYFALFGIILVSGMRQIRINNAVRLFKSKNIGEKPSRGSMIVAILGTALIIAGYVVINLPVRWQWAITISFFASLPIIAGTYMVFISGSAVICPLLKRIKRFYYNKKHFISVSQMFYRMKKNGIGLASTAVLMAVTLLTVTVMSALIFGSEEIWRRKYPNDISCVVYTEDEELIRLTKETFINKAREYGYEPTNIMTYNRLADSRDNSYIDNKLLTGDDMKDFPIEQLYKVERVDFIYMPVSDYNAATGKDVRLSHGEALIVKKRNDIVGGIYDRFSMPCGLQDVTLEGTYGDSFVYKDYVYELFDIIGAVNDFTVREENALNIAGIHKNAEERYVFISDEDFERQCELFHLHEKEYSATINEEGEILEIIYNCTPASGFYFGFDIDCADDIKDSITDDTESVVVQYIEQHRYYQEDGKDWGKWDRSNFTRGAFHEKSEYYTLVGGIFFFAVLLSVVFALSAAMIMYYKQITEGHEDRARYEILQNVGMSDSEIRRTVNSQQIISFFLPFLASCINIAAVFLPLCDILALFGITDRLLILFITCVCVIICAVFYIAVYKLTSRVYYRIVSAKVK